MQIYDPKLIFDSVNSTLQSADEFGYVNVHLWKS